MFHIKDDTHTHTDSDIQVTQMSRNEYSYVHNDGEKVWLLPIKIISLINYFGSSVKYKLNNSPKMVVGSCFFSSFCQNVRFFLVRIYEAEPKSYATDVRFSFSTRLSGKKLSTFILIHIIKCDEIIVRFFFFFCCVARFNAFK